MDAKGKRHSDSTLNCAQDKMRVRELALAGEEFTSKDLRKLTASVGWNLICGPELDHADLLLGWTLEAGDPPAGFDAVAGPKGVVYGYRLAAVGSDPGWKRVDLSQAALAAVLDRIRSMPGAPKDKPKLELIAGGERITSFAGGPVEVGSQASFEPTESDLAEIFAGLEESSADCFDPPLAFSSLERRGDMLRLVVDGNVVEIPWGNDWAEARNIEDQLFAALSQYQSQRAY